MSKVIGVDFDNTLICYDDLFMRLAQEAGLAAAGATLHQKAVREAARYSVDGDIAWQRLQGKAYGPFIGEARPALGALAFLADCRKAHLPVWIISHKTTFASIDPTGTDLRLAARSWLEQHGFLSEATGLGHERICFGSTRQEKIARIRDTGCTHFIDDLEETFRDPNFPPEVQGILYIPGGTKVPADLPNLWISPTWQDIAARILHA